MTPVTFIIVATAITLAWSAGRLAHRLGQPPVTGELAAGIVLGPSVFGLLAPDLSRSLLTPAAATVLSAVASAAVLVFMFRVGLELDVAALRRHARGVATIAGVSLVAPFALGCVLAAWLYSSQRGEAASPLTFTLFFGIAMSITAMPVLARILADLRMLTTTIGTMAIGCAVINDVVAWTLLGIVASLVRGQEVILSTIAMTAGYLSVMFVVIRPALALLAKLRTGRAGRTAFELIIFVAAVLSAMATERIGLHAVFGVFLLGVCVPRHADLLAGLDAPLRRLTAVLLPAFFIVIGLRTNLALSGGVAAWTIAVVILMCAVAGKLGGSALAARAVGLSWREALIVGVLLNTRGLVELVALDIGRSLGILSPQLFAMLVLMTFVTTMATAPVVRSLRVTSSRRHERSSIGR